MRSRAGAQQSATSSLLPLDQRALHRHSSSKTHFQGARGLGCAGAGSRSGGPSFAAALTCSARLSQPAAATSLSVLLTAAKNKARAAGSTAPDLVAHGVDAAARPASSADHTPAGRCSAAWPHLAYAFSSMSSTLTCPTRRPLSGPSLQVSLVAARPAGAHCTAHHAVALGPDGDLRQLLLGALAVLARPARGQLDLDAPDAGLAVPARQALHQQACQGTAAKSEPPVHTSPLRARPCRAAQ